MKKQPITKLVALALALTMLPATALAVAADTNAAQGDSVNNAYYTNDPDTDPDPDPTPDPDPDPDPTPDPDPVPPIVDDDPIVDDVPADTTPSTPAKPVAPDAVVVETIDNVKTETNENGQTVVTATVQVEDSTAPVVGQAKEGDVVAIVAETTGAVSAPAAQMPS